jgi:dihydroorotase
MNIKIIRKAGMYAAALFITLSFFNNSVLQAQEIDMLIKGGHVIDPKNKIDGKMDVAIKDGKVFRVAADIPASSAKKTVNAVGLYV